MFRTLLDIALGAAMFAVGSGQYAEGSVGGGMGGMGGMGSGMGNQYDGSRSGSGAPTPAPCKACGGGCALQGSISCLSRQDEEVKKIMLENQQSFEELCDQFNGEVCSNDGKRSGGGAGGASAGCGSCDACSFWLDGRCTGLDDPDFNTMMETTGQSASEVCEGELGEWCGSEDPMIYPPSPPPAAQEQGGCGGCDGCYWGASNYCLKIVAREDGETEEEACEDEGGTWCRRHSGRDDAEEGLRALSCVKTATFQCQHFADPAERANCIRQICGADSPELYGADDDGEPEGGCATCKDGCWFESKKECIREFDEDSQDSPFEECEIVMGGSFCGDADASQKMKLLEVESGSGDNEDCKYCRGGCVLPEKPYCLMPGDPDVAASLGMEFVGAEGEDVLLELTPDLCASAKGVMCAAS